MSKLGGMLILTRRIGEALVIGDTVSITMLGREGNQIRIGIIAPKSVTIRRVELDAERNHSS